MNSLSNQIVNLEREILTDIKSVRLPFIGFLYKIILAGFPIGISTIFVLFRESIYHVYLQIAYVFVLITIFLIARRISNWYTRKKKSGKRLGIRGMVMKMDILLEKEKEKYRFYEINHCLEKYSPIIKKYFPDSRSILKTKDEIKPTEAHCISTQTTSHFFEESIRKEVEKERILFEKQKFEDMKNLKKTLEVMETEIENRMNRILELEGMVRKILKENRAIHAQQQKKDKEPHSPGRFIAFEKKKTRGLFETVLDKIFPSDENSFALICSQCNSHNGLTPKESIRIFKCFHCKYLNVPEKLEKEIMGENGEEEEDGEENELGRQNIRDLSDLSEDDIRIGNNDEEEEEGEEVELEKE